MSEARIKTYIVAGSYTEYVDYIKRKGLDKRTYVYVSRPEQLKGLIRIEGFYIGTWKSRPDIEEIKMIINIAKYSYKAAAASLRVGIIDAAIVNFSNIRYRNRAYSKGYLYGQSEANRRTA